VRGLLRKRAKKYQEDSDHSDGSDNAKEERKPKKRVQKASMSAAFQSIMGKKLEETGSQSDTP
jgi:hypothetical protein